MNSGARPAQPLCISVTFLTGRYHGDEWPPSPARLYQALVAAMMTCGYRELESLIEPALRWLEEQPAPRIRCCAADQLQGFRIAVPNNDMDVIAWEWQQGRHKELAELKTMKQIAPRILPESGPHVQYIWDEVAGAPIAALQSSAHILHTLGWGVDMAFAGIAPEMSGGEIHEPSVGGSPLAVPIAGTLDDLKAAYARFIQRSTGKAVDSSTRARMLASQPYRKAGEEYHSVSCFQIMNIDGTQMQAVPWEECQTVAAWLRHRSGEELKNEFPDDVITGYVQGHLGTPENDKSNRLSYVPLPTIYGPSADGWVRRAMIVEPAGSSGQVSKVIERKLSGAILTKMNGEPVRRLVLPEKNDWTFRQYLPPKAQKTWRSVTPVLLHGFNTTRRGVISSSKTEQLLIRAFEMAGFRSEQIERLSFQSAPLWPGTRHASAIRLPEHLSRYPRLHVEVQFTQPVRGPVLAGIGRHYGIGVFAAW